MATNDRNVVVLTHAVNATLSIYLSRYRDDGVTRSSTTACDYFGCIKSVRINNASEYVTSNVNIDREREWRQNMNVILRVKLSSFETQEKNQS